MKYYSNFKNIITISTLLLICNSCSKENIIESPIIFDDLYVIDTLEVNILYEETPGFNYPMMKHYINTVTRLTKKGAISGYSYICPQGNIDTYSTYDYFKLFEPGYKFRNKMTVWSTKMIEPKELVKYNLHYSSDLENGNNYYDHSSIVIVKYSNEGIKPENNSIQLTGPNNWNHSPRFSKDGRWIYYRSSHNINSIFRTDINGYNQEEIELFEEGNRNIGLLEISNDNKLIYVIWEPNKYSKIVFIDLITFQKSEIQVHGFLWGSRLINIPNTKKYLNLLDNNSSNDFKSRVLIADIETQKVDTLLKDSDYQIIDYTVNPIDNKLYLTVYSGNKYDIIKYDYFDKSITTYLTQIEFARFRFLPNGIDYGYTKYDSNRNSQIYINVNGVEKQLTTYPGDSYDFDFSPDGSMIVFPATRRGEVQSWLIRL